jgi:hypothetical protein
MKVGKPRFTPHPVTEGPVRGVIVDVTPPERKQTPFGEKDVFRIVIESEIEKAPGERHTVWSKAFTPTLNEKASFRKFLKMAFGRDVAETDLDASGELDVDALCIGHPVQIIVVHEESDGNVYANISHIMPDRSGEPLKPSGKYVRKANRPPRHSGTAAYHRTAGTEESARAGWQTVKVHVGKCTGIQLGDLEREAVEKLISQWLPKHQANPKPTADDKRLAAALAGAEGAMAEF